MPPITIEKLQESLKNNEAAFADALGNYFTWRESGKQKIQEGRSGALFETFGIEANSHDANKFTYVDCFAPSFLSVDIPPKGAYRLVEGDLSGPLNVKLAKIPTDAVLDAVTWAKYGDNIDSLFQDLKSISNIGWVGASKLLARKRPELIPVLDNVLYHAFDLSTRELAKETWERIGKFVSDPQINNSLISVRQAAVDRFTSEEFPDALNLAGLSKLSIIRVLDICVWEEHHEHVEDTPDTCLFIL
jgi:hypothetical protein